MKHLPNFLSGGSTCNASKHMRVAAIDCGTNSIRLLIADVDGANFREIVREMDVVRLGQGVDKTGQFHPDAIARTLPPKASCHFEKINFLAMPSFR